MSQSERQTSAKIKKLEQRIAELERENDEMERARAVDLDVEETLRESHEQIRDLCGRLTSLVDVVNMLSVCPGVDELCKRAVELGRSRLGFERLGIWFCTDEPGTIIGSYGVGLDGNIVDERGMISTVSDQYPDGRVLLGNVPFVLEAEAPITGAHGEVLGHAPQAFAAIWDGERVIGHISADTAVTKRPMSKDVCEILRLYGSAIGYLCARKRVESDLADTVGKLEEALHRIKTLRGLVPICCVCKKIRDDQGYWQKIEEFIQQHSEAEFSHGICPDCAQELYPDLYARSREEKVRWDEEVEEHIRKHKDSRTSR
ncbi:MAG: hypothetical protein ACOCVL_00140 [Candidatus Sumerlaeota bacterium]